MTTQSTEQSGCKLHAWLEDGPQDDASPCKYCESDALTKRLLSGSKLRPTIRYACSDVDAAIASGEVLIDDAEREQLRAYVERWMLAINNHESLKG